MSCRFMGPQSPEKIGKHLLLWPTENKAPQTQRVVISPAVGWKGHGTEDKP